MKIEILPIKHYFNFSDDFIKGGQLIVVSCKNEGTIGQDALMIALIFRVTIK